MDLQVALELFVIQLWYGFKKNHFSYVTRKGAMLQFFWGKQMRKTTSIIRFHLRNWGCCLHNNCVLHDVVRFGRKKSYHHDVTLAIFKFAANLQQIHQHQFHNLPLLKEHNDLSSRSSWKQNIMLLVFKIASRIWSCSVIILVEVNLKGLNSSLDSGWKLQTFNSLELNT